MNRLNGGQYEQSGKFWLLGREIPVSHSASIDAYDERSILDQLVTGPVEPVTQRAADEVTAHSMMVTPISPATKPAVTPIFHEVAAHALKVSAARPAAKPAAKDVAAHELKEDARPAARPAAKDVAAHSMDDERADLRANPRIDFDPTKEEYRIIP